MKKSKDIVAWVNGDRLIVTGVETILENIAECDFYPIKEQKMGCKGKKKGKRKGK